MGEGDTQMRRVRTLLVRAIVGALVLLSLGASLASAADGRAGGADRGSAQFLLPEDPGLD
jgi:hypothetical protein